MKKIPSLLIFALFFVLPMQIKAQEDEQKDSPATERAKRKKAKESWKKGRETSMGNEKAVKNHHKKLQTKKTRKMMKKTRKKGDMNRPNRKRR